MPNHITNELIFRGVDDVAATSILAKLCNADGNVDFEVLVPTPPNVWLGNVGQFHEKRLGREMDALDWSRANWGTKWNAYGHKPVERVDDALKIRFDTAWSPPYPWLVAVFNVLKRDFEHNWMDEGASRGWEGKWNYAALVESKTFADPWTGTPCSDEMQKHLNVLKWGVENLDDEAAE